MEKHFVVDHSVDLEDKNTQVTALYNVFWSRKSDMIIAKISLR